MGKISRLLVVCSDGQLIHDAVGIGRYTGRNIDVVSDPACAVGALKDTFYSGVLVVGDSLPVEGVAHTLDLNREEESCPTPYLAVLHVARKALEYGVHVLVGSSSEGLLDRARKMGGCGVNSSRFDCNAWSRAVSVMSKY